MKNRQRPKKVRYSKLNIPHRLETKKTTIIIITIATMIMIMMMMMTDTITMTMTMNKIRNGVYCDCSLVTPMPLSDNMESSC